MKKLILFMTIAALSLSCSDDDDKKSNGSTNKIAFKVDGESKTFTNITVDETVEEGVTVLTIIGVKTGGVTESIYMSVEQGETGENIPYLWSYTRGSVSYSSFMTALESTIEINSESRIKGYFDGELSTGDENGSVFISDGSFDIRY